MLDDERHRQRAFVADIVDAGDMISDQCNHCDWPMHLFAEPKFGKIDLDPKKLKGSHKFFFRLLKKNPASSV